MLSSCKAVQCRKVVYLFRTQNTLDIQYWIVCLCVCACIWVCVRACVYKAVCVFVCLSSSVCETLPQHIAKPLKCTHTLILTRFQYKQKTNRNRSNLIKLYAFRAWKSKYFILYIYFMQDVFFYVFFQQCNRQLN